MILFFLCLNIINVIAINSPGVHQVTIPVDHGESPVYSSRTGLLYFVSSFEGTVLTYNTTTQELNSIQLHGDTSTVIPLKSNPDRLLVGVNRTVVIVDWKGGKNKKGAVKVVTSVSPQFPESRLNDGKADSEGRLWIGTVGPTDQGVFYLIKRDNVQHPAAVIAPVSISNGLAWNKANNKFYYIDSPTRKVHEYDYNHEEGTISNPRVLIDLANTMFDGLPDGMTIDKDDNLWIALWGGGGVLKVDSRRGDVLQFVPIPAFHVTSVIWGGPNYDILYVTTGRHHLEPADRARLPAAGSLFAVTNLGTSGFPMFDVDLE